MKTKKRGQRLTTFFIVLITALWAEISGAQEIYFSPREELMQIMLDQLQEKREGLRKLQTGFTRRIGEEAIEKIMPEAQLPEKGKKEYKEKKPKTFYLKKITSRVHPYLNTETSFNDNVDALPKKRSDLGYTSSTGFKTSLMGQRRSLNLDAHMDNYYHERHPLDNTQSLGVSSAAAFGVGRNTLSVSNNYFTNWIANTDFGINEDEYTYYWSDALGFAWARNFNRLGFELGYGRSHSEYEETYKISDGSSDTFTVGQYLLLAKKTRLSLDYSCSLDKSERVHADDSRSDSYSVEIAGVLSPKITHSLTAGYQVTDPKEGADSRGKTFAMNLAYRVSNRTNLSLRLGHSIHKDKGGAENTLVGSTFALSGTHRLGFNPKLSLNFQNSVGYQEYPKNGSDDNDSRLYAVGLGLGYAFRKWLDLSLDWSHARMDSNLGTNYNQNTVVFKTVSKF